MIFKTEITDFFIFCQEKPNGKLFSKIRLKLVREFLILRNPTKRRITVFAHSAENPDIFTSLLEKFGLLNQNDLLQVCLVSQLQHKNVKILPRSAFSLRVRSARWLLVFAPWKKTCLQGIFEGNFRTLVHENYKWKIHFLQSPVIALQHIKNSAWAIEKLYSKTCVTKGFWRVIYTTIARVTKAQFLPRV